MFKLLLKGNMSKHLFKTCSAYGIGYPEDMYAAFRTAVSQDPTFARDFPNIDIGRVFESWVQNPGSPVVNVYVNMTNGEVTLTQVCL